MDPDDKTNPAKVRLACIRGLNRGLEHAHENDGIKPYYNSDDFENNQVSELRFACRAGLLGDWLDDLMEEYMCEVQSSATLAINCFGPLLLSGISFDLGQQRDLRVHSISRATRRGFEEPDEPALYVTAVGPGGTVVIDVSCLDYLTPVRATQTAAERTGSFARPTSNQTDPVGGPADWKAPSCLLDTATLRDRARRSAGDTAAAPAALTYLYWEPMDSGFSPLFEQHREEIAAFATQLADGAPQFEAISCFALWDAWADSKDPRLRAHAATLRARYEVPAWAWEGVDWVNGRLQTADWLMDLIEEVDAENERAPDAQDH
ncbi:MAG: hypothetical protein H0W59_04120 [Chloroflexia bacterium]|nr:hypothetical protein [Chloroflexia bacterium]